MRRYGKKELLLLIVILLVIILRQFEIPEVPAPPLPHPEPGRADGSHPGEAFLIYTGEKKDGQPLRLP
jgi:hypothetical protein